MGGGPTVGVDRHAGGFSLLELVVVLLVMVMFTVLTIVRTDAARDYAHVAAMQADLRSLVTAQESHHAERSTFAGDPSALDFTTSEGVSLVIEADADGWTALASHEAAGNRICAIVIGDIEPLSPASEPGRVECAVRLPSLGG